MEREIERKVDRDRESDVVCVVVVEEVVQCARAH